MARETKASVQIQLPKDLIETVRQLIEKEPWCANDVDVFVLDAVRQRVEAYQAAL